MSNRPIDPMALAIGVAMAFALQVGTVGAQDDLRAQRPDHEERVDHAEADEETHPARRDAAAREQRQARQERAGRTAPSTEPAWRSAGRDPRQRPPALDRAVQGPTAAQSAWVDQRERRERAPESRHGREATRVVRGNPEDGRDDRRDGRERLDRQQQERRMTDERQRAQRYHLERQQQQRWAEQRAHALQQQRRIAQHRYQQQYHQRLRLQQAHWDTRRFDHYNDPYFSTPASYRFNVGGRWQQTNRHGADLLRQAVNYGYQEGLRAGEADRYDRWRNDYRNTYAYQDANYGYNGYYVDQAAYNHYFREGFARGYDDAYGNQYRHGRRDDSGQYAILAGVLGVILGLQLLH